MKIKGKNDEGELQAIGKGNKEVQNSLSKNES